MKSIVFEFDDEKDAEEVMKALLSRCVITWHNETKRALMVVSEKTMTVKVSKSIVAVTKTLRL